VVIFGAHQLRSKRKSEANSKTVETGLDRDASTATKSGEEDGGIATQTMAELQTRPDNRSESVPGTDKVEDEPEESERVKRGARDVITFLFVSYGVMFFVLLYLNIKYGLLRSSPGGMGAGALVDIFAYLIFFFSPLVMYVPWKLVSDWQGVPVSRAINCTVFVCGLLFLLVLVTFLGTF